LSGLGDVPGVVFPSGAIVNEGKNEILLYYGAADRYVGLAIGNYQEILEYLKIVHIIKERKELEDFFKLLFFFKLQLPISLFGYDFWA
jgi:hypothetical protein